MHWKLVETSAVPVGVAGKTVLAGVAGVLRVARVTG